MEDPSVCPDCGCQVRSIAARECRASDCPLNSANRQRPLASDRLDARSGRDAPNLERTESGVA